MNLHLLNRICHEDSWNLDQIWNSNTPVFPKCLIDTLFYIIPLTLFVLVIVPIEIIALSLKTRGRLSNRLSTWNFKSICQILAFLSLIILTLIQLAIFLALEKPNVYLYIPSLDILTKLSAFIVAIVILSWNKHLSIYRSGSVWFLSLWMSLTSTANCILLITGSLVVTSPESILIYIQLLLSWLSLILMSFSTFSTASYTQFTNDGTTESTVNPRLHASFLSLITFHWMDSLILKGYKKDPLEISDIHELYPTFAPNHIGSKFSKIWGYSDQPNSNQNFEGDSRKPKSVWSSLLRCLAPYYILGLLTGIINDSCDLLEPFLLKWLLNFMADSNSPIWHGYLIIFSIGALGIIANLAEAQSYYRLNDVGCMSKTAINYLIYRKALRVSVASRSETTTGEIVNLMSVDADRFKDAFRDVDVFWSGIIRICFSLYFLYGELGTSIFAGLGILVVLFPITTYLSKLMEVSQTNQMKHKDERIKLMNEILNGIKVIKLYAWEKSFSQLITDIRKLELKKLKVIAYLQALFLFIYSSTPILVSLVTFITYVLIDPKNVLTSEKAFVSLAFFNILRFPLNALPEVIMMFVMTNVANKRLNKFFNLPEMKKYVTNNEDDCIIRVTDASFKHGEKISIDEETDEADEEPSASSEFALKSINMKIKEGSFIAIVGQVGSGKSSLLTAILGEMDKTSGDINIIPNKSIAYVAQQAWIQNDSLKNNVLFGSPLDERKYQKVISGCQLLPDLEILPAGDETEIGEKGINLSGGQKQRLSLARACYANCDIYLLDDPLSAVDSHVSNKLFTKILNSKNGFLASKTRILVTNNLNILPMADEIYVLSDGVITESGKYDELIQSNGNFSEFVKEFSNVNQDEPIRTAPNLLRIKSHTSDTSQLEELINSKFTDSDERRLIESERMEKGRVKLHVYLSYFKNVPFISLGILFLVLMSINEIGTNYWLSLWADDGDSNDSKTSVTLRLSVYSGLSIITCTLTFLGAIIMFRGANLCAMKMHSLLLSGVLRCPMKFFDTTPVGRVLNRFSKDIEEIDDVLPETVVYWAKCIIESFFNLLLFAVFSPLFIVFIIPVAIIYYGMLKIYVASNRSLQRLQAIHRSPMYSHFSETLNGIVTIRAFNCGARLTNESDNKLATFQRVSHCYIALIRWMTVRLRLIGSCIVLFTATVSVMSHDKISPAITGLVFTYAISITGILDSLIFLTSSLESEIVAVERVLEYSSNEPEAEWDSKEEVKPPSDWPNAGCIEFKNYSTRYREALNPVLKNLNFTIGPGEKVGIVGRTGAGKSSMTLSLFRLLEPTGGTIFIDGVDITKIGLHDLRDALTIIPQDPILFCGKLRTNLDPFDRHTDEQLWRALELAHLKSFVLELEGGLDHSVAEGGSNLSVGQRQLLCLARALLKKTQILILDEATAAVDLQTDSLILATVRSQFGHCTILTIAHRLNTIIDSDRVLVLDQGEIAEFDSPVALMADSSSLFHSLAKDAGLV